MLRPLLASDPQPRRKRAALIAILAVALALVVTCAVALLRSARQLDRSIGQVQRVGEARVHLDALQRLVLEAETSQRGHLLTGLDDFLAAEADAAHQVPARIDALGQAVPADDAEAHALLDELRRAALAKVANLRAVLDLAARGGRGEAASIVAAGSGIASMARFRGLAETLDAHLAGGQSRMAANLLNDARFRSRLILLLLAANVALVAAVVALAWQYSRMRGVVRIVSHSRTIEHEGEWITYAAYLDRRFGVQTSRGITGADVEKLGWVRTPPGARPHPACRRRSGRC